MGARKKKESNPGVIEPYHLHAQALAQSVNYGRHSVVLLLQSFFIPHDECLIMYRTHFNHQFADFF